jgi:hypothetical protein
VVGVVGAVVPLGAVGTTGAGADHEMGVADDCEPDDFDGTDDEVDEPWPGEVGEPVVDDPGDAVDDGALVVDDPLAAVVDGDPVSPERDDAARGPDADNALDPCGDGFDEPPPPARTKPTTRPITASPPIAAALRILVRRDKRIG